jgi:3-deoxy-D-manno-octulosonic acid kinase
MDQLIARDGTRSALEAWLDEFGTLSAAAAAHPSSERLRGRGVVWVVPSPVETGDWWVVRHYHRGGAVAGVLDDRYLRLGRPRPFAEYRIGRALEALGVPTPRHVGAAWYPAGPFYRGDLVTVRVPDSRDLAAVLFPGRGIEAAGLESSDPGGAREPGPLPVDPVMAMEAAGRLIRHLHDEGVAHPDLNVKNVLLAGTDATDPPRALVIDLDRARLRQTLSEGSRRRMLERFWRSVRKWEEATGRQVEAPLREAFRSGYGS